MLQKLRFQQWVVKVDMISHIFRIYRDLELLVVVLMIKGIPIYSSTPCTIIFTSIEMYDILHCLFQGSSGSITNGSAKNKDSTIIEMEQLSNKDQPGIMYRDSAICGPFIFYTDQVHIIDTLSKIVFPVGFVLFNAIYFMFHRMHPDTVNWMSLQISHWNRKDLQTDLQTGRLYRLSWRSNLRWLYQGPPWLSTSKDSN